MPSTENGRRTITVVVPKMINSVNWDHFHRIVLAMVGGTQADVQYTVQQRARVCSDQRISFSYIPRTFTDDREGKMMQDLACQDPENAIPRLLEIAGS